MIFVLEEDSMPLIDTRREPYYPLPPKDCWEFFKTLIELSDGKK